MPRTRVRKLAAGDQTVLLTFAKPRATALVALKKILAGQPILAELDRVTRKARSLNRKPDCQGRAEDIIEALHSVLKTDYQTCQQECHEWNGDFDYQVVSSQLVPGLIEVLTILYNPKKGGNIFYGRYILRKAPDEYWLWIQD